MLSSQHSGIFTFEVEGADLAAEVLRQHGVAGPDIDRVWEAIALHSCHGLAERRGLLTYLTYKGIFIDAGQLADALSDRVQELVFNAYPRPSTPAPAGPGRGSGGRPPPTCADRARAGTA